MLDKLNLVLGGKKNLSDNFMIAFGDVNNELASQVVEWVIGNNYADEPPEMMTLFINSAGGDLSAAWAIIDVISGSAIPIRIIGLGQLASAGLLIFMSGKKGMRILTENTSIMSHQYFWGAVGKHHELMAVQKEFNLTQERLMKHIKSCTGLNEKQIDKMLMPPHDVYMSAEDALKLGVCDIIKNLK